MKTATLAATTLAVSFWAVGIPALAAEDSNAAQQDSQQNQEQNEQGKAQEQKQEHKDAKQILDGAVEVVQQMRNDSEVSKTLSKAKGVFLVPDFGRGAFVIGGRGGRGVLMAKQNGDWGNPAFFNFGTVSVGGQAGVSAGQVAMLLMTDDAVDSFKQDNNFSLNADAGLSLIDWSANAEASAGKGDIVFWSDTEGLFGGGAISVGDVYANDSANKAFYGKATNAKKILSGQAESDKSNPLEDTLP